MKIHTRDQLIKDYNAKYPLRSDDAIDRVTQYFADNHLDLEKACTKAAKKATQILKERKYESIHLVLYEYPTQTHRPRTTQYGHIFSPNAAANKIYFDKAVHSLVKSIKMISTPAEISIEAYLEMPKTVPPDEVILFEAKLLTPVDKPDYDNIGKCYTDMLQGIFIPDDDLFYHGEITKYYSLLPRVEVYITYLVKNESDYIYKKLKNRKTIKAGIESGQIILEKLGM